MTKLFAIVAVLFAGLYGIKSFQTKAKRTEFKRAIFSSIMTGGPAKIRTLVRKHADSIGVHIPAEGITIRYGNTHTGKALGGVIQTEMQPVSVRVSYRVDHLFSKTDFTDTVTRKIRINAAVHDTRFDELDD